MQKREQEGAAAIVEGDRRQPWTEFRERSHPGREMVFWLARRHAGMTLGQLGERAAKLKENMKQLQELLFNVEM